MTRKHITVEMLARVEGEGGLTIRMREGRAPDVKLRIFEPPRFFEAFLRGRSYAEAPDMTARICGICPVAYQMSSVQAMEDAFDVVVTPQIRALRRLLYCAEWIESHALHVYLLHAPDFLGYDDAIRMATDHREVVERGLRLKKIGNALMAVIGGREIHPVNVRVGGFYRAPSRRELAPLIDDLAWALDAARETVRLTATFPFPDFEQDYEFVGLRHPDEYPICHGRLASTKGLDIPVRAFPEHFVEEHVEHSNALHGLRNGRHPYHVGPLARYNLNFARLPGFVQDAAHEAGLTHICRNPFKSIIVRSLELLYACHEARRLIEEYEPPDPPFVTVVPQASTGHGCTEAPRGILYHRYRLDDLGAIQEARIVPPTAQNLPMVERDLGAFVQPRMELPIDELTRQCEQAVRNYDPCISCATHFLRLNIVGARRG